MKTATKCFLFCFVFVFSFSFLVSLLSSLSFCLEFISYLSLVQSPLQSYDVIHSKIAVFYEETHGLERDDVSEPYSLKPGVAYILWKGGN